jgi:hypothetical protein
MRVEAIRGVDGIHATKLYTFQGCVTYNIEREPGLGD